MPGYSVIADTTETLQAAIDAALVVLDPGNPPRAVIDDFADDIPTNPPSMVLYLYEILQDPATRNRPMIREEVAGAVELRKPPLPLVLRYLLTPFAGDRVTEQRMLARTMQALHDRAMRFGPDLVGDPAPLGLVGTNVILKIHLSMLTLDQMKPLARIQHDEMQSWCNDPDEIPEELRTALRNLRGSYAQRAETIKSALDDAKSAINRLKSPLDEAKSAEADAQATFERTKTFETTVNGWFTELTGLHKSAKGDLDARDYRLVFAYFLEAKEVWRWIRSLDETLDGAPAKKPDWLLQKLNQELRGLVEAKRKRYLAHWEWLAKDKAVTSARANYKYFIEDRGRRKDFIREAQDIGPAQAASDVAGAGNGSREASNETGAGRGSTAAGKAG